MFKKIKSFFLEMNNQICRIKELCWYNRKDIAIIRLEVEQLIQLHCEWNKNHAAVLAGINKTLSSLEMELLIARGASLDNNFEGKQDL